MFPTGTRSRPTWESLPTTDAGQFFTARSYDADDATTKESFTGSIPEPVTVTS